MTARILIVDDERTIRESLELLLNEEKFETQTASNGRDALNILQQTSFDILITDLKMPEMDGLTLVRKCQTLCPDTSIIIITAYGSLDSAIEALRSGAFDYILKPFDLEDVLLKIRRLVRQKELIRENQALRREIQEKFNFSNIVGQSPQMQQVFRLIEKVAKTTGNVLITGRSGTGKELVARAIHFNSDRNEKPFVPINCGAIVGTLLESEFFGHKKGSFTGAVRDKDGLFKIANEGTLFLDEVGDIPLHLQVKLLRAIEEGEILPVGGTSPVKIDVRIIAATNRKLLEDVENGTFRDDLYYRLNVVEIQLPALSERREDIPLLVEHFIRKYNSELGRSVHNASNETMQYLVNYEWRGGIRELENVIERALILCEGDFITPQDLPPNISGVEIKPEFPDALKEAVAMFEGGHLLRILKRVDNNKEEAAKILNISLSSLYRKLDELNIKPNSQE